ncbi:hypothetical protein ID866_4718 [Astraeus odoratus]|nr:hypothetical protein ID866_4718 [Astraeus odoratus]
MRIISYADMESASAASSSTSPSPSPPSPTRHRLVRKRSPSPSSSSSSRANHVSPFSNHLFSRPYSPSSRADDVARLLDPAYASPAQHAHSAFNTSKAGVRQAYVDHHGDLHDPDFRHFPVFHAHHRPRWESAFNAPDDEDSDFDEYDDEPKRASFETQRRRPSSSTTYHHPVSPTYPLFEEPSSYDSRYLAEEDEDLYEHTPLKEKERRFRPPSPRRKQRTTSTSEKTDGENDGDGDEGEHPEEDWT